MIQDIYPSKLHNEYAAHRISAEDPLFAFNAQGKVLLGNQGERIAFPMGKDAGDQQTGGIPKIGAFSFEKLRQELDENKLKIMNQTVEKTLEDKRKDMKEAS